METPELSNADAARAAAFLKSIANEYRLLILCRLAEGEMSVGELHKPFPLSLSSFSQHLSVLRKQKLVKIRKVAQTVYYSINDPDVFQFMKIMKNKFCPDSDQHP